VLSDEIKVRNISRIRWKRFSPHDKMSKSLAQKTPNECAEFCSRTDDYLLLAVPPFSRCHLFGSAQSPFVLWSLLVCLILTTIADCFLLSYCASTASFSGM